MNIKSVFLLGLISLQVLAQSTADITTRPEYKEAKRLEAAAKHYKDLQTQMVADGKNFLTQNTQLYAKIAETQKSLSQLTEVMSKVKAVYDKHHYQFKYDKAAMNFKHKIDQKIKTQLFEKAEQMVQAQNKDKKLSDKDSEVLVIRAFNKLCAEYLKAK